MPIPRPNRRAVAAMVKALQAGGLLEHSDAGIVALAKASADTLDEALAYGDQKLYAISGMMRTHLAIIEALTGRASGAEESLTDLLASIASEAAKPQ